MLCRALCGEEFQGGPAGTPGIVNGHQKGSGFCLNLVFWPHPWAEVMLSSLSRNQGAGFT